MYKSAIDEMEMTFEDLIQASEICRILNDQKCGEFHRDEMSISMYSWFFDPDFDLECTSH